MNRGAEERGLVGGKPRCAIHLQGDVPLGELIRSGATVMVGGFGEPGTPFFLIDALCRAGVTDLTVIKNDANEPGVGVGQLLRSGVLESLITSHIGLNPEMIEAMHGGQVRVEFHPQGILAEKIRCGGAGIPAFLSDIGVGVLQGEESGNRRARREIAWGGEQYLLEPALRADVALLHAHLADVHGNLLYRKSARNFNPLMAMAAQTVIVEVEELLDEPIDPECVHTPGCFVDHLLLPPKSFEAGTRSAGLVRASGGEEGFGAG